MEINGFCCFFIVFSGLLEIFHMKFGIAKETSRNGTVMRLDWQRWAAQSLKSYLFACFFSSNDENVKKKMENLMQNLMRSQKKSLLEGLNRSLGLGLSLEDQELLFKARNS